ncbi:MAG TPA: MFS transporter [Solirubrobacteraceae bacterium]|nr:MFS transporter [Solirubrobacteraceae bacterium]
MSGDGSSRRLRPAERRLLLVLGLPTLTMAFSTTAVSTYLPVVARRFTASEIAIGLILAGEGLMALVVPLIAGTWSDTLRARGGSRLTFMLAGMPLAVCALAPMGLVGALPAMGALVAAFFAGNFFSYEPYRALYPDLLDNEIVGRAQGTQAVWRGCGTVLALAGGGVMLSVWSGLPFVAGAALEAVGAVTLALLLPRVSERARGRRLWPARAQLHRDALDALRKAWELLDGHRELRLYLVANVLWELSLGALKTFIVLYVTRGLGRSLSAASLIIGAVAVVILAGAVTSGRLGDRYGEIRVMRWGLWLYGCALAVLIFTHAEDVLIAAAPIVAFGGGLTMTLPYAILVPLMPDDSHGMLTGFYSLSRGLGVMLGPLLAGVAIQLLHGPFAATHGYAAMWIVSSGSILASIPVLNRLCSRLRRGVVGGRPRTAAESGG